MRTAGGQVSSVRRRVAVVNSNNSTARILDLNIFCERKFVKNTCKNEKDFICDDEIEGRFLRFRDFRWFGALSRIRFSNGTALSKSKQCVRRRVVIVGVRVFKNNYKSNSEHFDFGCCVLTAALVSTRYASIHIHTYVRGVYVGVGGMNVPSNQSLSPFGHHTAVNLSSPSFPSSQVYMAN